MIFYLGIAFVLFIYASLSLDTFANRLGYARFFNRTLFFLLGFLLVCLGGFRWLTGSDWNAYYHYFNDLNTWKEYNNGTFEIAYTFLNFLVKCVSSDYTAFLLVQAFICVSLKLAVIKKLSFAYGLCLFLYYCYTVGDIFAVRQTLAISILIFSILSIQKKNWKKFVFLTLLATSIHNTSIVWLIAYPIYWKKFSQMQIYKIFAICFIIGLISGKLYSTVIPIIVSPFSTRIRLIGKLVVYATGFSSSSFSIATVLSLVKRLIFLPLFLYCRKKYPHDKTYNGIFNIWMGGTCIYLLFSNSLNVFQRMTTPFILLEFILLPYIIRIERKKYFKPIVFFLICAYAVTKLVSALNAYPDLYIPYYSIFYYEPRIMY